MSLRYRILSGALCAPFFFTLFPASCVNAQTAFTPDDDTALLLHFDGDTANSSNRHIATRPGGEARFVAGKFGQALALDGTQIVTAADDTALHIGEQSWTFEAWFKPEKELPTHSVLVAGGWGGDRQYGLRISNKKFLTAYFSTGTGQWSFVVSPDLSNTLFDGNWHHAAAVIDRERRGEVRLYLDGKRIESEKPAFMEPMVFESGKMGMVVGAAAPWDNGSRFRGLIDEVRISNRVRTEYSTTTPLPPLSPEVPAAPFTVDAAASKKPVTLQPEKTFIVLPQRGLEVNVSLAAQALQNQLRKIYGVKKGFEQVQKNQIGDLTGKVLLALGASDWTTASETKNLLADEFIVRRKNDVIVITGGSSRGTLAGTTRFLDEFAAVRFYMPGDLWTSTPSFKEVTLGAIDIQEKPFVRSASFSGIGNTAAEQQWFKTNLLERRIGATHQHNMFQVFPPKLYAEKYPDIYPIYDGKRYIPNSNADQNWQPNFASPQLLEAAEESALRYFKENPIAEYLAFSVQDGHRASEDVLSQAAVVAAQKSGDPKTAVARAQSALYWEFMNKLAVRLEKKLPNKLLVGLAYSVTRYPPAEKLHPNLVPFANLHIAELEVDGLLTEKAGPSGVDNWLRISNHYGNHDWFQGNGYLIPRTYTNYYAQFFRHLQKAGLQSAFAHVESYPSWGLDGPKYYIVNRLFWNPQEDINDLWKQFSTDMFGPAAIPMQDYFQTLEKLWVQLDNVDGPERKLSGWNTQFVTTPKSQALIKEARAHLDTASTLAITPEQKDRLELFSKTYRLSEMLFDLASQNTIKQSQLDAIQKHFTDEIATDPMTLYKDMRDPKHFANVLRSVTASKKIEP